MATTLTPTEARALDQAERELDDRARQPALSRLADAELRDLIDALRNRRDRARDIGNRQRREARGKAAPQGSTPAARNDGTRGKEQILAAALRRAMAERSKRQSA
ncbi:hypothetical protein ACEYYB_10845 [Paracoccus sp. p4-l81]|uniref:hypothetical protein n=1 Tax=unclassified Paracoccus (in: a-proteobacteria) TaxID=2688777 RepID=UPI0035BA9AC2